MARHSEMDRVKRGSYRTQKLNVAVYQELNDSYSKFEHWLQAFIDSVDVDVMPGAADFSSGFMPQQPTNSVMFPKVGTNKNLNLVTNPHHFHSQDLEFIVTSGNNLEDIRRTSNIECPLECLERLLNIRHLAPTAPDTLRAFPFAD